MSQRQFTVSGKKLDRPIVRYLPMDGTSAVTYMTFLEDFGYTSSAETAANNIVENLNFQQMKEIFECDKDLLQAIGMSHA